MLPAHIDVLDSVVATAAAIGVYVSAHRLASGRRTRQTFVHLAAFSAVLLLLAGAAVMHTYLLKSVGKSLELPQPRQMEYEWKDSSASEISRKTRILAASHYVTLGHIVDYISVEGARTPYVPTEADIGLRDQLAASRLSLFADQKSSLVAAYSLISGALTALVLGLVLGKHSRKVNRET